ncbi:hypothetical protein J2S43_001656 [Catenuloplanes nepalensis]|uniref:Uncharacterized protein n=1 Tax=Catenuloplanes nepalensis TaxID=587533 RepID=A0ABT9MP30_9ACTN|nr:hypothetical protein [Catenuloplanes nepalensis]MDP9793144.1 hypothetical protein [Catenuloplanes nepalensis]
MSGLTPEQQARVRRLLRDELRAAWDDARAAGATEAELAESVERRRRALEAAAVPDEEVQQPRA